MQFHEPLFENAIDGVLVTRLNGEILHANPAACRLLGTSEEALRARGWGDRAVDEPGLRSLLEECERRGITHGEARFRLADGSAFQAEVTAAIVPGRDEHRHAYLIFRDITGRRRAEEALRASEERFRQLAENAREVFWLLDVPGGRISYVNPAYEALWGRSCQSLYDAPEDWFEVVHPEDRQRVVTAYAAARAGPYDEEYRLVHPDGSIRWVRDRSVPVRDGEGTVVRVAGIAEDITARKHSEEALRRTNRALLTLSRCNEALVRATSEQALYEEISRVIVEDGGYRMCWVGLVEHDERRTIRPVAQAGDEDGYLSSLEVVWSDTERGRGPTGTAVRTLRPVVGRDFLTDPTLAPWRGEALKRGYRSSAALPLLSEGACFGVLSMYASGLDELSDGEVKFLEQLADDLAFGVAARRARVDRDRLSAHLVQADRLVAMGTLAAGVGHEINNPLAYVISSLDHLEETLRAAPLLLPGAAARQALDLLAEAREGAERVRLIVGDLKTFSRIENARVERLQLPPVIESSINMARNELKHRARVVTAYGPVPTVLANATRLGQVFLNLLINAAHAIPAGRVDEHEVRITTSTDANGRARVEVRDSGAGVPPELAGRIFEPFVTSKRPGEGTGLGLSICRSVIAALGGEIAVESDPGHGSTFRVTLPAAGPDQPKDAAPAPAPAATVADLPAGRRGRVAVVDDEPGIRRAIGRALASAHEVVPFERGRALADRIAAGEHFDAILCDMMMPDMSGMELHQVLSLGAPEQADAMIFMTGGAFTPEARAFLASVPNARVDKPFDIAALRALVRSRIP